MRTTIDLPEDLFREVKIRAVQQGTTLKNLVTQLVRSGLTAQSPSSDPTPARRNPPPVAIKRRPEQAPIPARTNRQLYAILEGEEIRSSHVAESTNQDSP